MMIQEENDMTQEMRQLVMLETNLQLDVFIKKIEESKIPITDEWTDGVNTGLEWASRILKKDKSAYQVPSQSRKHRGYRSQKVLADYLASNGFPFAESTGAGRSGSDITGCIGVDWEVKARTGFNPSSAIKQLKDRARKKVLGVVCLRLNGQGEKSIADWVVVLRLEDAVNLLREAGYGEPK